MDLFAIEAQAERAIIVPGAGFQCFSYKVGALDVIAGPPSPESWLAHPHRGGVPLLFPWPGRIAEARFTFAGREYRVPVNEPARGNSIHGFACEKAFRVVRRGPYFISAILDSAEHPELALVWPWPFSLELDYEVGNGLRLRARIANTGDSTMPFGFGAHPYFHAPLSPPGARAAMLVQLDADARWPLDANFIPTGVTESLAGKYDLRAPRLLDSLTYDDAFRMSTPADSAKPRARLIDPAAKVAIDVLADSSFGNFVVYAPPESPVVALEPYTCAPDAFNLAARGIEAGMRTLAPGRVFEARLELRLSAP
jgi:aldose 1-epimerase